MFTLINEHISTLRRGISSTTELSFSLLFPSLFLLFFGSFSALSRLFLLQEREDSEAAEQAKVIEDEKMSVSRKRMMEREHRVAQVR